VKCIVVKSPIEANLLLKILKNKQGDSLGDSLRGSLGDSLGGSLWGSLGDSLRDSLGDSLRDSLRDSLGGSFQRSWENWCWYGNITDLFWVMYYYYLCEELFLGNLVSEKYRELHQYLSHLLVCRPLGVWVYENICILSKTFLSYNWDEDMKLDGLHRFEDGWYVLYNHGSIIRVWHPEGDQCGVKLSCQQEILL
jgi:hypothetical protein